MVDPILTAELLLLYAIILKRFLESPLSILKTVRLAIMMS
jgi:hypothetical protein